MHTKFSNNWCLNCEWYRRLETSQYWLLHKVSEGQYSKMTYHCAQRWHTPWPSILHPTSAGSGAHSPFSIHTAVITSSGISPVPHW